MVGIGAAMILLFYFSNSWEQPLVLAGTILISFVIFRVIGSFMVGYISNTQLAYIGTELIEFTFVVVLLIKAGRLTKITA